MQGRFCHDRVAWPSARTWQADVFSTGFFVSSVVVQHVTCHSLFYCQLESSWLLRWIGSWKVVWKDNSWNLSWDWSCWFFQSVTLLNPCSHVTVEVKPVVLSQTVLICKYLSNINGLFKFKR